MGKNTIKTLAENNVSAARSVAYYVLRQVETQPFTDSRELVRITAKRMKTEEADTRLAVAIVLGCLRYRTTLDLIVKSCLERPNKSLLPFVVTILRMVAFQHHYLDRLPPYAICNDAVELVSVEGFGMDNRLKGFVNAVSKKIVSRTSHPAVQDLSEKYSFPAWLVGLFKSKFGESLTPEILGECNCEPPVALRVNRLKSSRGDAIELLRTHGIVSHLGRHVPDSLILEKSGDLPKVIALPEFSKGYFYFQDEASQMVSVVAAPQENERVLDLCAAPGGKTTHLAELSGGKAEIIATDINDARLDALRENVNRMSTPGVSVIPWEDLKEQGQDGFDLVVVDAPCSGLGTLRRNPEIKWRVEYKDLMRLRETQFALLNTAMGFVKSGGRLLYSTCSFTIQENDEVIQAFCHNHPGWKVVPQGRFSSWPDAIDMDGFCIFMLKQTKN